MHQLKSEEWIHAYAKTIPKLNPEALIDCFRIGDLNGRIHERGENYLARHGLSVSRFRVLTELYHAPTRTCTPAELAERIQLTRAGMTTVLDGLEKEGYVQRAQHESDRRRITVTLTKEGGKFMDGTLPNHYRRFTRILGHLTKAETLQLTKLLEKLHRGCDALLAEAD